VSKMSANPALKSNSLWVLDPLVVSCLYLSSCSCKCSDLPFCRQTVASQKLEKKLDLTDTIKDGARLFLIDSGIRRQLIMAFTEDSKLHVEEVLLYIDWSMLMKGMHVQLQTIQDRFLNGLPQLISLFRSLLMYTD
jgi:hypothetical protein